MARTLAFDRAAAVRGARAVFWRDGYAEASLPALEEATGLSRSSIYNSFGSKRGLFDAAVQSYLDEVIRPRLRPLRQRTVAVDAVLDYLDGLGEAFARLDGLPGCLLVNTAGTPLAEEAEVARIIAGYRAELRGAIANGILAHGAHLAAADRECLTDAVTGLVVAAFALVRVDSELAIGTLRTARELVVSVR